MGDDGEWNVGRTMRERCCAQSASSASAGVVLRGNAALAGPQLQRAIGVVYRPEPERRSHYFHVRLARRFDALVHLDETRAVEPPDRPTAPGRNEPPKTFPSGL